MEKFRKRTAFSRIIRTQIPLQFFCIKILHHLNEGISAINIHLNEITREKINFVKFYERFISKIRHNYKSCTGPAINKSNYCMLSHEIHVKPHKLWILSYCNVGAQSVSRQWLDKHVPTKYSEMKRCMQSASKQRNYKHGYIIEKLFSMDSVLRPLLCNASINMLQQ